MKDLENLWDKKFQQGYFRWKNPHWTLPDVAKFFKKHGVRKILDLGCGAGRHVVYFAKKNFFVVGVDTSPTALRLASKWLKRERLSNYSLVFGNMFDLPFPDEEFDAVVSIAAIDNFKIKEVKKAVNETNRVLKNGGLFFANFASTENENFLKWKNLGWKKIERYTYFHPEGLMQSYFTEKNLLKILPHFKILKLYQIIKNRRYYPHKVIKTVSWHVLAKKVK